MQTNTAGRQRHEGFCADPFGKPGNFHGMLGQITGLCSFQIKVKLYLVLRTLLQRQCATHHSSSTHYF